MPSGKIRKRGRERSGCVEICLEFSERATEEEFQGRQLVVAVSCRAVNETAAEMAELRPSGSKGENEEE